MSSLLDQDYNDFREIRIDETHSEYLSVHREYWEKEIVAYERRSDYGCFIIGFISLIVSVFVSFQFWKLLLILVLIFFIRKIIIVKRCNNLRQHGDFNYEFKRTKIVRYTSSNYKIFFYKDIQKVEKKSYGLILKKKSDFLDDLGFKVWKINNPDILILPCSLPSFIQVANYAIERINQETK